MAKTPKGSRTPRDTERRIIEAYLAEEQSVEDIASTHDVSKQTVYTILRRNGIELRRGAVATLDLVSSDAKAPTFANVVPPDDIMDRMARQSLQVMLEELVERTNEVTRLEGILRRHGINPDAD